jgi:hypothetical protein
MSNTGGRRSYELTVKTRVLLFSLSSATHIGFRVGSCVVSFPTKFASSSLTVPIFVCLAIAKSSSIRRSFSSPWLGGSSFGKALLQQRATTPHASPLPLPNMILRPTSYRACCRHQRGRIGFVPRVDPRLHHPRPTASLFARVTLAVSYHQSTICS